MVLPYAAADCGVRSGCGQRGFTLIELVTVMVIVGIMAVVVAPRFADNTLNERGFHDAVQATLQHARRSAVASRRYQCVDITGGAVVAVTRDTRPPEKVAKALPINCSAAISLPSPWHGCALPNRVCAPTGVVIGGTARGVAIGNAATLIYDPQGRLITAPNTLDVTATITITGAADIIVVPETGYTK